MKFKTGVYLLSLALVSLIATGCAAVLIGGGVAAGVGTVAYVRGELKTTESVPLARAWSASLAAVKDLQFLVLEKQKDGLNGRITARGADDKKIQIALKMLNEKTTEIRIRVGTFGDETQSRLILDRLKKHF
ncbi:MAG: DUF3568 family protein [Verrucomicrobia bacterium]|nr:DUF3568 family protein [Verrucomicrobiota bacterium]